MTSSSVVALTLKKMVSEKLKTVSFEHIRNKKANEVYMTILSSGKEGINIRSLSERCDVSVYAIRSIVLKLEALGLVYSNDKPRNRKWTASL